jgi:hypothetical protein
MSSSALVATTVSAGSLTAKRRSSIARLHLLGAAGELGIAGSVVDFGLAKFYACRASEACDSSPSQWRARHRVVLPTAPPPSSMKPQKEELAT